MQPTHEPTSGQYRQQWGHTSYGAHFLCLHLSTGVIHGCVLSPPWDGCVMVGGMIQV